MNGTLPLFEELEAPRPEQPSANDGSPAGGPSPGAPRASSSSRTSPEPSAAARERHLRAAWRLSRAMKRLPDRSPEQTRVGVAICRHLQALLARAD